MMTYIQVQKLLATFAPEMLQLFADKFERFPVNEPATVIAKCLNDKSQFYSGIDDNVANQLAGAANEVIERRDRMC